MSEDGQAASFAGQYETYLGVSGVDDVLLHIAQVLGQRVLRARPRLPAAVRRRVAGPRHDLAVGVLELVDARSAGVAFTLDPVTGDRGVCVVEGNWGFGESVVSGQVTPDHWTVDRASGRVLTARTGAKLTWAAVSPADGRVVLSPLPDDLAGRACLSEEEVRYIARGRPRSRRRRAGCRRTSSGRSPGTCRSPTACSSCSTGRRPPGPPAPGRRRRRTGGRRTRRRTREAGL